MAASWRRPPIQMRATWQIEDLHRKEKRQKLSLGAIQRYVHEQHDVIFFTSVQSQSCFLNGLTLQLGELSHTNEAAILLGRPKVLLTAIATVFSQVLTATAAAPQIATLSATVASPKVAATKAFNDGPQVAASFTAVESNSYEVHRMKPCSCVLCTSHHWPRNNHHSIASSHWIQTKPEVFGGKNWNQVERIGIIGRVK